MKRAKVTGLIFQIKNIGEVNGTQGLRKVTVEYKLD
jgi:hypothetical protein